MIGEKRKIQNYEICHLSLCTTIVLARYLCTFLLKRKFSTFRLKRTLCTFLLKRIFPSVLTKKTFPHTDRLKSPVQKPAEQRVVIITFHWWRERDMEHNYKYENNKLKCSISLYKVKYVTGK